MAVDRLAETLAILAKAKERSDSCLVAFSGGKDSWAVLDLCTRTFSRVECVLLSYLPGLEQERVQIERAENLGIKVHTFPSPSLLADVQSGRYCDSHWSFQVTRSAGMNDIFRYVAREHGLGVVATGRRRSEGFTRAAALNEQKRQDVIHPIKGWRRLDVVGYLGVRGIPLPPGDRKDQSGISLDQHYLLWCHENFPEDFERIKAVFPYVEAVLWREHWYGSEEAA